jgi:hypothetical protein
MKKKTNKFLYVNLNTFLHIQHFDKYVINNGLFRSGIVGSDVLATILDRAISILNLINT